MASGRMATGRPRAGLRVVGGAWRGRAIDVPPAGAPAEPRAPTELRPTTDRARETLFNVLAHNDVPLPGATVLDAFAGTGALGIEALSRGAAHATFIERDGAARRLLAGTLRRLGGEARAAILSLDATSPGPAPRAHDLALLDPPYGRGLGGQALAALLAAGWLATGARVVIEEEKGASIAWPDGVEPEREVSVGGTRFHLARWRG